MTDGLGSSNVHSNNYYDYRTVTTFTMHLDGSVSVSTSYEILYRNGLKDFDLSYGSSNVKPKGHIKDKADGWSWGQITEKIYRPGGLRLISNDAGGGTNVIALNDVKSIDVGLLLSALGGFSSGLKGGKAEGLERFKAIFDGVEKLFESAEGMTTGEGSTGTGEGNTETGLGGTPNAENGEGSQGGSIWTTLETTGKSGEPGYTETTRQETNSFIRIKKDSTTSSGIKIRVFTDYKEK